MVFPYISSQKNNIFDTFLFIIFLLFSRASGQRERERERGWQKGIWGGC